MAEPSVVPAQAAAAAAAETTAALLELLGYLLRWQ